MIHTRESIGISKVGQLSIIGANHVLEDPEYKMHKVR